MGTSATQLSRIQSHPNDQRLSPRKRVSLPIPIELIPGKEVWLLDLGEGGLSVSGSSRLELGTNACTRFQFPETKSLIDAAGVVAWSDDSGRVGVRFTHVKPDTTAALRRWLRDSSTAVSGNSIVNQPDAELANQISCLSEVAELQSIISAEEFDCDAALNLIVRRMTELTRATGAAIALREGEDVVCRARAGNAPDVGVRLSPTSLSGQCFQTGTIVMLEDSETDSRVNPELCRQLNFRSLLVLPITQGTEIIGIAEVLSPNPRNFAGGDILTLSFLNDLIASVAMPRIERDPSAVPEVFRLPDFEDLAEPEGLHLSSNGTIAASLAPAMERIEVEPELQEILAAEDSAILIPAEPPVVSAPPPMPIAASPAPALQIPRIPDVKPETAAKATVRVYERTAPSVAHVELGRPLHRLVPLIVTVFVLLATAALLAGYYLSRSFQSKQAPSTASIPATTPSPTTPAITTQQPANNPAPTSSATPATHKDAKPAMTADHPSTKPAATSSEAPALNELQVVQGGGRHATVNAANSDAVPEAPAFTALATRGSGSLPASVVAGKTASPKLQAAVPSQGVVEGKLIRKVVPRYPDMARAAGISGDVVLSARIGVDGGLHDIKVVSGSPLLRAAAIDAAKEWRYSPYTLGGKPVETDTRITLSFHR